MTENKKRKKRIMVSIDTDTYKILEDLKGFGNTLAEKVSRIVTAFLSEKSYLKDYNKKS